MYESYSSLLPFSSDVLRNINFTASLKLFFSSLQVLEEHQLIVGVVVVVDPGKCNCDSVEKVMKI